MENGVATVGLDQLVEAALTGKPYNQQRLGKEALRFARAVSTARAKDLPEDLHEEICQQALLDLWDKGASALQEGGGKKAFLVCVLASIRVIRSNYATAGEKTRRSARKPHHGKVAAHHVDQIHAKEGSTEASEEAACPTAAEAFRQIDYAIDARAILAKAPPQMKHWLVRLHFHQDKLENVAQHAGLSRFALHRRLEDFYDGWRRAA